MPRARRPEPDLVRGIKFLFSGKKRGERDLTFDTSWRSSNRRKSTHEHFARGGRFGEIMPSGAASSRNLSSYGGKYRKSKKRKTRRKYDQKTSVKKIALSLCEPKQLRAIEEKQQIGNNIPHFYTGGCNMGVILGTTDSPGNQVRMWSNQFSTAPISNPSWTPLREAFFTSQTSTGTPTVHNLTGGRARPVGRRQLLETGYGDVTNFSGLSWDDGMAGSRLDKMNGHEICPTKLQYKITFNASQTYSPAGCNAVYTCILFKYKTTNLQPERDAKPLDGFAQPVDAPSALNCEPRSNVGWNPWVRSCHFFKGGLGTGASYDLVSAQNYNRGNLKTIPDDNGAPSMTAAAGCTERQLSINGSLLKKDYIVLDKKEFTFRKEIGFGSETISVTGIAPLHQQTVYLTHRFKPGSKMQYGLVRSTPGVVVRPADPTADPPVVYRAASPKTMEAAIQPEGYNYGVAVYCSALPITSTTQVLKISNWQWTAADPAPTTAVGGAGRMASYDIQKSFYYRDP